MSRRITTDDVRIERRDPSPTGVVIEARVRGVNREYIVDHNPAWGSRWFCSCGKAQPLHDCTHVRAVRQVVGL